MPVSSYQVQRLLREFRRIRGQGRVEERPGPDADRVMLSEQGDQLVQSQREHRASTKMMPGEVFPGDLADRKPLTPAVEHELERRAGSFMNPPVVGDAPFMIPKMKRWPDP